VRVALTFDTEHPGRPTRPGTEDEILATLASEDLIGGLRDRGAEFVVPDELD
jgi:hypothetical protein